MFQMLSFFQECRIQYLSVSLKVTALRSVYFVYINMEFEDLVDS